MQRLNRTSCNFSNAEASTRYSTTVRNILIIDSQISYERLNVDSFALDEVKVAGKVRHQLHDVLSLTTVELAYGLAAGRIEEIAGGGCAIQLNFDLRDMVVLHEVADVGVPKVIVRSTHA